MPELPEVETTVEGLKKRVLKRTFLGVWTDTKKYIKRIDFKEFEKKIEGKKILNIYRRGKNIIFDLSDDYSMLVHQKLSGHLLYGKWEKKDKWKAQKRGVLDDRVNTYIHLVFFLDNGYMLALSDLRKFAKVEFSRTKDMKKELDKLGPEPLEITFNVFKSRLKGKKKIKAVLLDQNVIVGIGNIYSDEALWKSKIHPFRPTNSLKEKELKNLYNSIKDVLKKGIKLRGESFSDYRDVDGKKGDFDVERKVYKKEGQKCSRCNTIISREKMGSRSTRFCPKCQTL